MTSLVVEHAIMVKHTKIEAVKPLNFIIVSFQDLVKVLMSVTFEKTVYHCRDNFIIQNNGSLVWRKKFRASAPSRMADLGR